MELFEVTFHRPTDVEIRHRTTPFAPVYGGANSAKRLGELMPHLARFLCRVFQGGTTSSELCATQERRTICEKDYAIESSGF